MSKSDLTGGTFTFINNGAIFSSSIFPAASVRKPTAPSTEKEEGDNETIPWGDADSFPNDLITDAKSDTVILPGLRFKTDLQFAGGISHGLIEIVNNKEVFVPQRDPAVVAFFRASQISKWYYTTLYDYNYFANAFPVLHFSNDGKKITHVSIQNTRAKNCRLKKLDQYGNFTKLIVDTAVSSGDTSTGAVDYDCAPNFGVVEWLKEKKSPTAIVVPLQIPDDGNQFYSVPDWNSARESKWIEISRHIAIFKKFLIENQVTLKYHIQVHPDYWQSRFKEKWDKADENGKRLLAEQEFNDMSEFLTKPENTGKSLMSTFGVSGHTPDKNYDMVQFTAIENKFSKDGVYIEDSKEASDHKISALGLHPDLLGSAPGNTLGSGSGSGNRVAFNQRASMSKPYQDMVLHVLGIVRDFNGWNPELEFRGRQSLITTLDTGASATKPKPEA